MVKEDLRRVFIVLLKSIFYSFQIENSGFFWKKMEDFGPFWAQKDGKGGSEKRNN